MLKEALAHINSGEGNCATAAYRALLPTGVEPLGLHDFMLNNYPYHIEHIAACAALQIFRKHNILCSYLLMPDTSVPSEYFQSSFSDNTTKDEHEGLFLGGLIRRCYEIDNKVRHGHVIAVTAYNNISKTAHIVDRTPHEYNDHQYAVPVEELDNLVTKLWVGQLVRVLILVGLTRDNPLYYSKKYQDNMLRSIEKWTAWEQSYVPAFKDEK